MGMAMLAADRRKNITKQNGKQDFKPNQSFGRLTFDPSLANKPKNKQQIKGKTNKTTNKASWNIDRKENTDSYILDKCGILQKSNMHIRQIKC